MPLATASVKQVSSSGVLVGRLRADDEEIPIAEAIGELRRRQTSLGARRTGTKAATLETGAPIGSFVVGAPARPSARGRHRGRLDNETIFS